MYRLDLSNKLVLKFYLFKDNYTKYPRVLNIGGIEHKKLIQVLKTAEPEYLTLKINNKIKAPENLQFTDVAYYRIETKIENTD